MKHFQLFLLLCIVQYSAVEVLANNIKVTNVSTTGQVIVAPNNPNNYTNIVFDLTWDNSWRNIVNWDAAWIFVKYQINSDPLKRWYHARLSPNGDGYTVLLENQIEPEFSPVSDSVGVFLFRKNQGAGNINWSQVKLRWYYRSNGVNGVMGTGAQVSDNVDVTIKVFAIEMCYVPTGGFFVGSGGTKDFRSLTDGMWKASNNTGPTIKYYIGSEGTIPLGTSDTPGFLRSIDGLLDNLAPFVPAAYPKGYQSFFCQKYEITQGEFRDFLNTISFSQQQSTGTVVLGRTIYPHFTTTVGAYLGGGNGNNPVFFPENRQGLKCIANPGAGMPCIFACDLNNNGIYDETTYSSSTGDGIDIPCKLTYYDGISYADWSGLRPMSELEFEKACRGNIAPFPDECAWGTSGYCGASSTFTIYSFNSGTGGTPYEAMFNDCASTASYGNAAWGQQGGIGSIGTYINGPVRVGAFAKSTTNRVESGASYYGIMELSGNMTERCVILSTLNGLQFDGQYHGDGWLLSSGLTDIVNWQHLGQLNPMHWAMMMRGGNWFENGGTFRPGIQASFRSGLGNSFWPRYNYFGFRCVRTAN